MFWLYLFLAVLALLTVRMLIFFGWNIYDASKRGERELFIDQYQFPESIWSKVKLRYPHLTEADLVKVRDGLREYFQICNLAGRRMVAMPSQVVDVAWHEFILYTRNYQMFCRDALGRFLHHTPAEAMTDPQQAQAGIKRAWRVSCKRAVLDPKAPGHLPVLFAIDSDLAIEDGYHYHVDCSKLQDKAANNNSIYCAGHIGCGGGCAGSSGGCSSDGGVDGCSSGCSSCGGGCGGD